MVENEEDTGVASFAGRSAPLRAEPPAGSQAKRAAANAGECLGRFDHHPDPAIDFCIEVEELENIAEGERLGLEGYGHEADRETLDSRIQRAMDFRVGGDSNCISAKAALRNLATARGFVVTGEIAYAGQPMQRTASAAGARSAKTPKSGLVRRTPERPPKGVTPNLNVSPTSDPTT